MEVEREDGRVCEVEDVVMESLCTMIEIKIVTCKSLSLSLSHLEAYVAQCHGRE